MTLFTLLLHFTIGFIASFIGSIPLGSINAGVARISSTKSQKAAFYFIGGATLAELIYSFIAIHFSGFLLSIPKLAFYIRVISIPLFLLIGLTYFFAKDSEKTKLLPPKNGSAFLNGLTIGLLNPLQIPFWLAYGTYFINEGWIVDEFTLLNIFVLGIVSGSSFLLFLIAKFSSYYSAKLSINNQKINKATGVIFILLSFYQILLFIFES